MMSRPQELLSNFKEETASITTMLVEHGVNSSVRREASLLSMSRRNRLITAVKREHSISTNPSTSLNRGMK